jgi:aldose 1-epimerase
MKIETITIADSKSGAQATVAPKLGFNCISFVPRPGGEPCEVLWTAPDFLAGTGKPSHSGIPLLFPFAGRLRGTSFEYQGRPYELEAGRRPG